MRLPNPLLFTTLLLALPLTTLAKTDYKKGKPADVSIYFHTNDNCRSAVVAKKGETTNSNNPLEEPSIAYTLSRDLKEDEVLDFSVEAGGSKCGEYVFSAVGKRREKERCMKLDRPVTCYRLWTAGEAKELGD